MPGRGERLSGRQVVAVVVALCAALILTPVGVYAAATQKVSIADAKRPGLSAKVDGKRRLAVHMSGEVRTRVLDRVDARVSGRVEAVPRPPARPFHRETPQSGLYLGPPVPRGTNVAITSVAAANYSASSAGNMVLEWVRAVDNSCPAGPTNDFPAIQRVVFFKLAGESNFTHTFPVPHVRRATSTPLCLRVLAGPAYLVVDGYLF